MSYYPKKNNLAKKWDNPDRICENCKKKVCHHTFEERDNCYNALVNSIGR